MPTKLKKVVAVTNKYKVPQKLWVKFKPEGQNIFNGVMEQSLTNQKITTHPKMEELSKDHWETICWNMACYAAWSISECKLKKGDTVIDIDKKGVETKRRKVA